MATRTRILLTIVATLVVLALIAIFLPHILNVDLTSSELTLQFQHGASYPLPVDHNSAPLHTRQPPSEETVDAVRNVVLMIGDGLGLGGLSSGSALLHGADGGLVVEQAPVIGLVRTWASDDLTTGSAASASAMATGFKVRRKALSVLDDGRIPATLFEVAEASGMATGLVTTSGLADATPAAFVVHVDHRDKYHTVLQQILASETDVLIGGDWTRKPKAFRNREYMATLEDVDSLVAGRFSVVRSKDELAAAEAPVLALFPPREGRRLAHGPPLATSTRRALDLLRQADNGFILMLESEDTDEAAHSTDIATLVDGLREFDAAVRVAVDFAADRGDTLVIVTADHDTGGLSIVRGRYDEAVAKIRWASSKHSAQWVPLFAFGPGAEQFGGVLDNTEIGRVTAELLALEGFPAAH